MNKSLKVKICLSLVSFIFFTGILEMGLRLYGFIYQRANARARLSQPSKFTVATREADHGTRIVGRDLLDASTNDPHIILTIGDSYTYGGWSDFKETYPYLLQELLPSNIKVYNGGVCEYNSKQVLTFLPQVIATYNPDTIILLVGATNKFNFSLNDIHGNGFMNFIRNLRVYKMAKILALNLKNESHHKKLKSWTPSSLHDIKMQYRPDGYPNDEKPRSDWFEDHVAAMKRVKTTADIRSSYDEVWYHYNIGSRESAFKLAADYFQKEPRAVEFLCFIAYLYYGMDDIGRAIELYEQAFRDYPDSKIVSAHRAHFYEDLLLKSGDDMNNPDLLMYSLRSIESDPFFGYPHYWALADQFPLQSKYDANDIIDFLNKIIEKHPPLKEDAFFLKYYNYFENQRHWENKIAQWLNDDLEKIVKICKHKNIRLIIQNYPFSFHAANSALQHIAVQHSLPFVDNTRVFDAVVNSINKKAYFLDDYHCTRKGHLIMAENVYDVLRTEGYIRKGQ